MKFNITFMGSTDPYGTICSVDLKCKPQDYYLKGGTEGAFVVAFAVDKNLSIGDFASQIKCYVNCLIDTAKKEGYLK